MESLTHEKNCFVTLTYDDDHLPDGGSLQPKDTQLFLKRLRKSTGQYLRYFLCGEYGDRTFRPHYHLALFGLDISDLESIKNVWHHGHVVVGDLNPQSAGYIAGYVTKKMTSKDDPRLAGRYPEFSRMSNRRGIGYNALQFIHESLVTEYGESLYDLKLDGDVPQVLKHGNKSYPLGRYLRNALRDFANIPNKGFSHPALLERAKELQVMFSDAKAFDTFSQKALLASKNSTKVRSITVRFNRFNQKEKPL